MSQNGRSQPRQVLRPAEAGGLNLGPQRAIESNQSRDGGGQVWPGAQETCSYILEHLVFSQMLFISLGAGGA